MIALGAEVAVRIFAFQLVEPDLVVVLDFIPMHLPSEPIGEYGVYRGFTAGAMR